MKWIKGDEQQPKYKNEVIPQEVAVRFFRDIAGKYHLKGWNYSGGFYSQKDNCFYLKSPEHRKPDKFALTDIEWLDETPREDGEWISVETLPEESEWVLAYCQEDREHFAGCCVAKVVDKDWYEYGENYKYNRTVAHWMPLPSPPNKK